MHQIYQFIHFPLKSDISNAYHFVPLGLSLLKTHLWGLCVLGDVYQDFEGDKTIVYVVFRGTNVLFYWEFDLFHVHLRCSKTQLLQLLYSDKWISGVLRELAIGECCFLVSWNRYSVQIFPFLCMTIGSNWEQTGLIVSGWIPIFY